MMRYIIFVFVSLLSLTSAFADPVKLSIKVSGLVANKPYFLCLYGAGCYNMRASEKNIVFPLHSHVLPNLKRVFVADMSTKKMYAQPISDSCKAALANNKASPSKITILGKLNVNDSSAKIENLRCELS
jgi:hypothetical protein